MTACVLQYMEPKKMKTVRRISTPVLCDERDPVHLRDEDVCCGRGKGFWDHPGNKFFSRLVKANALMYGNTSSKNEKGQIVDSIVKQIESKGGRFVRSDPKTKCWYDIGETMARDKTGHAIRDYLLNQKKGKSKEVIRQVSKKEIMEAKSSSSRYLLREDHSAAIFGNRPLPGLAHSPLDSSISSNSSQPLPSLSATIDRLVHEELSTIPGFVKDLSDGEVLEVCQLLSDGEDPMKPLPFSQEVDVDDFMNAMPSDWLENLEF